MTATPRTSSFLPDRMSRAYSHRRRPHRNIDLDDPTSFEEEIAAEEKPGVEELRRKRADFYTSSPEGRRIRSERAMAERITPRRNSSIRVTSAKKSEVIVREVRRSHSPEHHHRRRRREVADHDQEPEYINVYNSRPPVSKPPPLRRSKTTTTASATRPREVRRVSEDLTRNHTERRKLRHGEDGGVLRRTDTVNHSPKAVDLSRGRHNRPSATR